MLPSPLAPWKGAPLRVMFAAEKPLEGELSLIAPDGSVAATSSDSGTAGRRISGSPKSPSRPPEPGSAKLTRTNTPGECGTITREIDVRAEKPPRAALGVEQRLAAAQ